MFILRNKRKESGLSLIEASLVIILSGLVIVLVQSAISKIIKYAVHENALHDVSYVMSYRIHYRHHAMEKKILFVME